MPLTPDQIAELYAKKAAPANKRTAQGGVTKSSKRPMSRIATQYVTLPPNHLVYYINGPTVECKSYGCRAPAHHRLRGQPLCLLHLTYALVHELNRYSHNGSVKPTEVSPVSSSDDSGDIVAAGGVASASQAGTSVVLANLTSEGDDGGYL